VLDTPPGKHFIDFLQSTQKINQFFDKSFIDIFKHLGKRWGSDKDSGPSMLSFIVSAGIKKLLKYLEKVTGETFVEEFIDAIVGLYKNKDSFLNALSFQDDLKNMGYSNWFLVTSVEQHKWAEATELQKEADSFMHQDSYLVVNKCLRPFLEEWTIPEEKEHLIRLRDSMRDRENKLKEMAGKQYKQVLEFREVLNAAPSAHVKELSQMWP
jgi:anion-transporting  ArsA/GET3 family ATPase